MKNWQNEIDKAHRGQTGYFKEIQIDMKISKTINQIDTEFAEASGMTYNQFKSLTLLEQSRIRKRITNKNLK